MNEDTYLKMQRDFYDVEAQKWSLDNLNPVVGNYTKHNNWDDYDVYLFKDFDTREKIALEYGCGPGQDRWSRHFTI